MWRVRLVLCSLYLASAGVQRGHCYCNVGVCYKRTADGETHICKSEEDFFGAGGRHTYCDEHPTDSACADDDL